MPPAATERAAPTGAAAWRRARLGSPARWGPAMRYGVAVVAAALSVAAAAALQPATGAFSYAPTILAVVVVVALAGPGPAVVAALAGSIGAALVLQPLGEPQVSSGEEAVRLLVYLAATCGVIALGAVVRRVQGEALEAGARLQAVAEGAPVGVALLDRELRFQLINPMLAEMNGLPVEAHLGRRITDVLPALPGELLGVLRDVLATGEPVLERPYTAERPDGRVAHVVASWYPVRRAGEERIAGVAVTVVDVTTRVAAEVALRDSRAQLELAMRSARMGAWELDHRTGRVIWSPALEALLGLPEGGMAGSLTAVEELALPEDRGPLAAARAQALEDGRDVVTEFRVRRPDGGIAWIEDYAHVVAGPDGRPERILGLARDVTERRASEEAARRAAAEEHLLAEVGAALEGAIELGDRLALLTRLLAPAIADACVVDLLDDGGVRRAACSAADPELEELLRADGAHRPEGPGSDVLADGQAVLVDDVVDADHLALRRSPELCSAIVAPLRARGRSLGLLTLATTRASGRRLAEGDLAIARRVADRAALSIDNALLYERERHVSHTLQVGLLGGDPPPLAGAVVGTTYRPGTTSLEVGGDWYDVFPLPGDRIAMVVGDVVGHGVDSAVAMGHLRGAVRALAPTSSPARLLQELDELVRTLPNAFASTLAYAVLDPAGGGVDYACAGHPPPLIVPAAGAPRLLWEGRSPPLACRSGRPRPTGRERLAPGDVLVLYTDGLIERRGRSPDDGLEELAAAAADAPRAPQALLDRLCDAMLGPSHEDDVCGLAAQWTPAPADAFVHSVVASPAELAGMRAALRRWLGRRGADGTAAADAVSAASEAVANAMEHGYGLDGRGRVEVRAGIDGAVLGIEVRDEGAWRPQADRGRGRGIPLMRALMDEVEIDGAEGGTRVVMRLRLESGAGTPGDAPGPG